jgi:ABC-type lipoprotein release transport system permease subunit
LALGAEPSVVKRAVVVHGMRFAVIGLSVGLAGAMGSTQVLRSLLYEVTPRDPGALAGACLLLGAACLLASYIPARRVTQVDPAVALRGE